MSSLTDANVKNDEIISLDTEKEQHEGNITAEPSTMLKILDDNSLQTSYVSSLTFTPNISPPMFDSINILSRTSTPTKNFSCIENRRPTQTRAMGSKCRFLYIFIYQWMHLIL